MNVLVVDVGGTHVKILATGQNAAREFPSGPTLTAEQMVAGVKQLTEDWKYDAVTIGYPGPVLNNRPLTDPWNLGGGWRGYDFALIELGIPPRDIQYEVFGPDLWQADYE